MLLLSNKVTSDECENAVATLYLVLMELSIHLLRACHFSNVTSSTIPRQMTTSEWLLRAKIPHHIIHYTLWPFFLVNKEEHDILESMIEKGGKREREREWVRMRQERQRQREWEKERRRGKDWKRESENSKQTLFLANHPNASKPSSEERRRRRWEGERHIPACILPWGPIDCSPPGTWSCQATGR